MFWNLSQPRQTFCSEHDIILPLQHTNNTIPVHVISIHHFNMNCDLHITIFFSLSQLSTNLQIFNLEYYVSLFHQNVFLGHTILIVSYFHSCSSCILVCTSETKSTDMACCTPLLFFRADPEADKSTSCTW